MTNCDDVTGENQNNAQSMLAINYKTSIQNTNNQRLRYQAKRNARLLY